MERCGNTIRNGLPEREDIVFVVTAISQASLVTVAAARGRSHHCCPLATNVDKRLSWLCYVHR